MIIREIKHNPDLLDNFDWFNNFVDTRKWALHNYPAILPLLDKKYLEWENSRKEQNDTN